jgi:YebC/PmpR family DNA-binding regulatory protein
MAWHSKRHNIKHRKAAEDAKKSKVYSKMGKLIEIAARGGADPSMNPSLEMVLSKAKYASVPKEVIERAIKKGSGQSNGAAYQTLFYEGYAPGGVALYIKTLSDNSNRTATNIRTLLNKSGGSMAEMGAVAWQFKEIGEIVIEGIIKTEKVKGNDVETILPFDQDKLENELLGLDISDYTFEEGVCRVVTSKENFNGVLKNIENLGYKIASADLIRESTNPLEISDEIYAKVERVREVLEDDDDVEEVYDNIL